MQEYRFPAGAFKRMGATAWYLVILAIFAIWMISGFYTVAPEERGVKLRFGKFSADTGPGLHWHWPSPIETVEKPKVTRARRAEIGFRTVDWGPPARYADVEDESLMLTGDENIIDVKMTVQYKIRDAVDYLFNVSEPDKAVKSAAEAALREVIGANKIDDALTEEKFRIQEDTRIKLQEILDRYQSGVVVNAVKLQSVQAPQQVVDAFMDVASAREDRERLIKEAEGYQNDLIPKARGQVAKLVKEAEAYQVERTRRAQGDAERFLSVYEEYRKAKQITETRLYLETMEKILPGVRKYVVTSDERGGILNVLQLDRMISSKGGQ